MSAFNILQGFHGQFKSVELRSAPHGLQMQSPLGHRWTAARSRPAPPSRRRCRCRGVLHRKDAAPPASRNLASCLNVSRTLRTATRPRLHHSKPCKRAAPPCGAHVTRQPAGAKKSNAMYLDQRRRRSIPHLPLLPPRPVCRRPPLCCRVAAGVTASAAATGSTAAAADATAAAAAAAAAPAARTMADPAAAVGAGPLARADAAAAARVYEAHQALEVHALLNRAHHVRLRNLHPPTENFMSKSENISPKHI